MIREYAETLNTLTEWDWCRYAFAREPLSGRLSADERRKYFQGAAECGASLAQSLKERCGELPVPEYARREGLKVTMDDSELDSFNLMFAKFTYPADITIYSGNAEKTDRLIAENGLDSIVGGVRTEDLLLAHELFHFYENRMPELYIHQKHLVLFKLGRFERRCKIICLSEIAAMSFAGALTKLPCSPYIYDVMMLYPVSPQRSRQQYEMILKMAEGDKA